MGVGRLALGLGGERRGKGGRGAKQVKRLGRTGRGVHVPEREGRVYRKCPTRVGLWPRKIPLVNEHLGESRERENCDRDSCTQLIEY